MSFSHEAAMSLFQKLPGAERIDEEFGFSQPVEQHRLRRQEFIRQQPNPARQGMVMTLRQQFRRLRRDDPLYLRERSDLAEQLCRGIVLPVLLQQHGRSSLPLREVPGRKNSLGPIYQKLAE